MAATRLIALHINKGKTVAQCLADRTLSLYMSDKVKIISGLSKCVCKASINIKSGVDNTPATLISTIFERFSFNNSQEIRLSNTATSNQFRKVDFEVTPHLLRHTYITNLIHASVDPKTVQYLAGHENSKITMDIYAKAKYNRPDELAGILEDTFTLWDAE